MLNIFCLFVLHIRIATIIKEKAKFNDKFLFRYLAITSYYFRTVSPVVTPCEVTENLQFINKMVTSFD